MLVHVIEVPWGEYGKRLSAIREEVFIAEQGVPREIEWDGADDTATHFLAIDEAGRDVGCARLLPDGQIGRMAVKAAFRGKGIGGDLLELAVQHAQNTGMAEVHLHAQTHATEFYAKHDFVPVGAVFDEANIPHQHMQRLFAVRVPANAGPIQTGPPPEPAQQATAGVFFDNEVQACEALSSGLSNARRVLALYSHYLDPAYFEQPEVVECFSQFARRARNTQTRILIHSSSIIVSRGHKLIELVRRLPSKFEVRLVAADYDPPETCFATWDHAGYWRLPDYREPAGAMRTDDSVRARQLLETFDQLWSRSKTDPNLRVLRI